MLVQFGQISPMIPVPIFWPIFYMGTDNRYITDINCIGDEREIFHSCFLKTIAEECIHTYTYRVSVKSEPRYNH
ncbi:hypothetical protein Hanom_Chr04g00362091 [Helianthus anomalus]